MQYLNRCLREFSCGFLPHPTTITSTPFLPFSKNIFTFCFKMTSSSSFMTIKASLMLTLLISMIFCSFINCGSAATVLQHNAAPLKECKPFTCLLEGLDTKCEIRTDKETIETTCGEMMRDLCDQVEENDRKYIEECHNGMNAEGGKCTKCEVASKLCRAVFDKLPTNIRSAMGVSKMISAGDQAMLQGVSARYRFIAYSGGFRCLGCWSDNEDEHW